MNFHACVCNIHLHNAFSKLGGRQLAIYLDFYENMKACLLTPYQPLIVTNQDRPPIAVAEEVIVKVHFCGICHSDLHLWDDGYDIEDGKKQRVSERPGFKFPVVPGHEISGTVSEIGPDVQNVTVGDKVAVYPIIGCMECANCRRGMEQTCTGKNSFIGFSLKGGYAEFVKVPNCRFVCSVPETLPLELAALLPCGASTVFNSLKKVAPVLRNCLPFTKKPCVLSIGAGNLGQWAVLLAKHVLPEQVTLVCTDKSEERLQLCKQNGADTIISSTDPDDKRFSAQVHALYPDGFEAVLDYVGSTETVKKGLENLKRGGTLVLVGLHGGNNPARLCDLILDSKTIIGSKMSSLDTLKELMTVVAKENIKGPPIAYASMDNINKTMTDFGKGDFIGKYVLKIGNGNE